MPQLNDYLLLIWKDPQTRRNFAIGKLSRGDKFTFEYCEDAHIAEGVGWVKLDAFPEYRIYESDKIFPVFSSRLPDRKRRDIAQILQKYSLEYYDEFDLLRKSHARLPIDTYEFVDPITSDSETIDIDFFLVGVRHISACNGSNCALLPALSVGDYLTFKEEPNNPMDPLALQVFTKHGDCLGYIPRYYNQAINDRLKSGVSYSCCVIESNHTQNCSECIKVKLNMPSKSIIHE